MWWNHSWIRQFHKPNGTRKSLSWWKKGSQGWQSPLFIVEQKTKSRSPVFCKASLVVQWVKNPPAMKETQVRSLGWFDPWVGFNPWVRKIPWRKKWQPTPVFLPGKSHGQRSLPGYSPWGRRRVKHNLGTKQQQQLFIACGAKHLTVSLNFMFCRWGA